MTFSYIEQSSNRVIAGVLSRETTADRYVDIFVNDLFLRRIPAHHLRNDIEADPNVRGFWFALSPSVAAMLPPKSILEARGTDGTCLPYSPSARVEPIGSANDNGAALRTALEAGCIIDKWGTLKTPFAAQPEKRKRYAQAMREIADYLYKRHGVVAFPHYGTLLGLVREGRFIDHDDDVDLSVAIYEEKVEKVIDRFLELMHAVHADGYEIHITNVGQFGIYSKECHPIAIDIFLTWGTNALEFNTYFGVCGSLSLPLDYKDSTLEGEQIRIPVLSEEILELTYGPNWRYPDPSFLWHPPNNVKETMQELLDKGTKKLNLLNQKLGFPGIGMIANSDLGHSCRVCSHDKFTVFSPRSDGVNVLLCENCAMGVVEHIPANLEQFYTDDSYYEGESGTGYSSYTFMAEHGVAWAASLVKHVKVGGRILDIGCADGYLLSKLSPSFERFGIEVNSSMCQRAEEQGIRIIGQDLLNPEIVREYQNTFDIVTSIAVFEHLSDIKKGFEASLSLLKHDGVLLFEVPLLSDQYDNTVWLTSSLEHIFYPSEKALRYLVEKELGFRLIGTEVYVRDFASTYVGFVTKDDDLASGLSALLARLRDSTLELHSPVEKETRIQLQLIHAATSGETIVNDLETLPPEAFHKAFVQRLQQVWKSDLHKLDHVRAHLVELTNERDVLSSKTHQLLKRSEQLVRERDAAKRKLATAKHELEAIRNSITWKIMFPVRKIGRCFPGLARAIRPLLRLVWRA